MNTQGVAVALFCKTPKTGSSKTRLSPLLTPEQSAALSAAFIRDVSSTMLEAAAQTSAVNYAVYTPAGSETDLYPLLPQDFRVMPQVEGDLGARLIAAMHALFEEGHRGVIFVNADGPTLPHSLLYDAIRMTESGDKAVIGPALDGGYTIVGMARPHEALFTDIDWSTDKVFAQTRSKALRLNLPVVELPLWYDVDDEASLILLASELSGKPLSFAKPGLTGAPASATRHYLRQIRHPRISLVS